MSCPGLFQISRYGNDDSNIFKNYWEVPQIIGTMAAMCISDFEIFAKNLFYTWGTKGFHQKKSLGCAKNSFSSDF